MHEKNYESMDVDGGRPIKMWTEGVPVEQAAKQQLANTARMPFVYKHIAVMPDVHLGEGSMIGCVISALGAVIPAAVGADIGCGMTAAKTTLTANDLPDNLSGPPVRSSAPSRTGCRRRPATIADTTRVRGARRRRRSTRPGRA